MEDKARYLLDEVNGMNAPWPEKKTVNIVFHCHSVPAGYFATPMIDTFHAYPHLVHMALKEHSESGAQRFTDEVLLFTPTWDLPEFEASGKATPLRAQTDQIRALAARYPLALVDSYKAFADYLSSGRDFQDLMAWSNHPNARGHGLVRDEILGWFPLV